MWNDSIIDEIHSTRDKILKDKDYNIDKVFEQIFSNEVDLKSKGWKFITKEDLKKKNSNVA